ncbi:hypothetical protein CTAYLR_010110 [Chrysophaeum taylorii]|uniref:Mini-chromosome maintenance complex-binding protein n=1 Tax=Chrysophaeum taylorii TaxID=2483200 RepID=A0AAD7XJI4_9STRA|nr:hypothetical protein CTAYLR_010110 [Chrysophaeum taylorii]
MATWETRPLAMVDALWDGCAESTCGAVEAAVASGVDTGSIPVLTHGAYSRGGVGPRTLVRWVGMVQDMGNPEMFLSVVGGQCTLYRDWVAGEPEPGEYVDGDDGKRLLGQRLLIYGVATPGETEWARVRVSGQNQQSLRHAPRDTTPEEAAASRSFLAIKRLRDDDEEELKTNEEETERSRARNEEETDAREMPKLRAKRDDEAVDCVIRFYGAETPLLNQIVEVVGVVGSDEAIAPPVEGQPRDEFDNALWDPPLSMVARIHALCWRRLDDWFPLAAPLAPPDSQGDERWEAMRSRALAYLTQAFYGDAATAEYILLALLAKPIGRSNDRERCVGSFTLDLVVPDARRVPVSKRLASTLAPLFPRCALVRASNARVPTRENERLTTSDIQLVDGTCVVLDFNLKAVPVHLELLIADPKVVLYDYGLGHEARLPFDAPLLVVTQNRRGTGADCPVAPFFQQQQQQQQSDDDAPLPDPDLVDDDLRAYLAAARHHSVDIDDDLAQTLQDHFVNSRQRGEIPGNEADQRLTIWISLCRLDAKSRGLPVASAANWAHCAKLERIRLIRYDSLKRRAGL